MRRRPTLTLDVAVPLLVAALIVVGAYHAGGSVPSLAMTAGLGAASSLWGCRRFPALTLAVSGALALVFFFLDRSAGPAAVLAPAVALYWLGVTRGRFQQLLTGTVAVAAVVLMGILASSSGRLFSPALGHIAVLAAPLLVAEALRTRRSYIALLRERLKMAERTREQEVQRRAGQERLRIARDLHDVIAHTLTEINVQAAVGAELSIPGAGRDRFEAIERASHDAVAELRAILGVLRDPATSEAPRAPLPGIDDIAGLVRRGRAVGLDATIDTGGERPSRLSDATSVAAYRLVQESLTNARRHAPGVPVSIRLRFGATALSLVIENPLLQAAGGNGAGTSAGNGITGMRERASALGGTCEATSADGRFAVRAELPYGLEP
jgi:signal transduction histidine kinase